MHSAVVTITFASRLYATIQPHFNLTIRTKCDDVFATRQRTLASEQSTLQGQGELEGLSRSEVLGKGWSASVHQLEARERCKLPVSQRVKPSAAKSLVHFATAVLLCKICSA